jgi:XrtJ-associated TM-motif-TM protein
MKKTLMYAAFFSSIVLCTSIPARAQFGGCDDSPENPTLILAGLAGGAFAVAQVRTRLRANRKTRNTLDR